jgi:hypothetical protein
MRDSLINKGVRFNPATISAGGRRRAMRNMGENTGPMTDHHPYRKMVKNRQSGSARAKRRRWSK